MTIDNSVHGSSHFSAAGTKTVIDVRFGKSEHKTSAFHDSVDAFAQLECRHRPFFRPPIIDGLTSPCIDPLESTQVTACV